MECAAIQDVLVVGKALDGDENRKRKIELDRMAAMLSRLGGRGYRLEEGSAPYVIQQDDFDPDGDFDKDLSQLTEMYDMSGALESISYPDNLIPNPNRK